MYQEDEARWQAVLTRDKTAVFYYAVVSTGIYCRPTCPSRRPNRENVRFYDTTSEAEQAGFRPCRRCRPESVSTEQRVVAEVQRVLDQSEAAPSLAELATTVGLSPFYLQRLFKRATGLSPKEYAGARRSSRLKAELKQGATVTDALYEAGYGSPQALYDKAQRLLGMTPGAYRNGGAGQRIAYAVTDTDLGEILVAATAKGICSLRFGAADRSLLTELAAEFPNAELVHAPDELSAHIEAVGRFTTGTATALDLPLDVKATAFQLRVWEALRAIPYGQVRSYSEVAAMIGEPAAVRAVARACAANPVALVVPCHRVVRANGELSGYRWGPERKRLLLKREGALPRKTD